MSITQDRELIFEGDLSDLSRKTLQSDVLEYQLRSLFVRPGYRPRDINVQFSYPSEKEESETEGGFQMLISGPVYTDIEDESEYSPFIRQWREFYRNYLSTSPFRKKFINGMTQLRFISFNPLTIYYQMIAEEQKKISSVISPKTKLQMRKMIVKPPRVKLDKPVRKVMKEEPRVEDIPTLNLRLPYYDGQIAVERSEEEAQRPGVTSWAEGYVEDEIPADIRKIDPEVDFPNGAIMNMFPDYPFYAFNYWNIFKKIEGLNRMIEAGLEVVFLKEVEGLSHGRVKDIYQEFFTNWGIPIIDYVGTERLMSSGLTYMIPEDKVLPGFYVIRRPIERLHSSAWAGMNGVRRRGLPGIPWARDELSGNLLIDPQPDDGFLSRFVREGLEKRIGGGGLEMEVQFPFCSLHTPSEIRRMVVDPLEALLKRNVHFRMGEGMTGKVELRSIGEWMLLRGLLRKFL